MTMFDLEEQLRWTPEQVKELIKFYRQFRPRKSEDNLDLEEDNLDLEEDNLDLEEDNLDLEEDNLDLEEDNLDLEEDNLDLEEEGHGELPRELQVYED